MQLEIQDAGPHLPHFKTVMKSDDVIIVHVHLTLNVEIY